MKHEILIKKGDYFVPMISNFETNSFGSFMSKVTVKN